MELLWFVLGILFSAFFSGLETGIYSLNQLRLRLHSRQPAPWAARQVIRLLQDKDSLLCMLLIGNNIANHSIASIATQYLFVHGWSNPEVVATAFLTPFLFIFGESVPKSVFRNRADSLVYPLAPLILVLKALMAPLVYPLKLLVRLLLFRSPRAEGEDHLALYHFPQLLLAGEEEGILSPYQKSIADNILRTRNIPVEQVMIPMPSVVSLPPDFRREDVLRQTERSGHSRFPVCDAENRRVTGVVHFFDCFGTEGQSLEPSIRRAPQIPATASIHDAFLKCREKSPLAAVIDERGLALGVVTIRDLLKYVLGGSDPSVR